MDAFSYTDIFDTKGIEYIVIIGFLLLVIPVWIALSRPIKGAVTLERSTDGLSSRLINLLPGLYFSKQHTWAHLERSGTALMGVDELLLHLTGGVSVEYLKTEGEQVREGEPLINLWQNEKSLQIKSPLTGQVKNLNRDLENNRGLINTDPYGKGWLLKIRPENWQDETAKYFRDKEAENWLENEIRRSKDFFAEVASTKTGEPVLQAGGELVDHVLTDMSTEIWGQFQKKFLS